MKTVITPTRVKLWLSANQTYQWASRPDQHWPCSDLAGKRLFVEYDSNGLCDIAINGRSDADCQAHELNAIVADHLSPKLPPAHPLHFVIVGQFA